MGKKKQELNLTELINIFHGDSLEVLKSFPDNSIDACISDPPYGISFMGKNWDNCLPPIEIWKEVYRVLKPNGVIVAMSATRTYHRLAVQLEEVGFSQEQACNWVFASGFPKATNLSKQIDRFYGEEREVVGKNPNHRDSDALLELGFQGGKSSGDITESKHPLAKKWDGWLYGLQALKPALEPCYVGRKEPKGKMKYVVPFIYQAKPSKKEKHLGCENLTSKNGSKGNGLNRVCEHCGVSQLKPKDCECEVKSWIVPEKTGNTHTTVKPIGLMEKLISNYTNKDNVVLDPFLGSGTTLLATIKAGVKGVGIEREEDYFEIAKSRIEAVKKNKGK